MITGIASYRRFALAAALAAGMAGTPAFARSTPPPLDLEINRPPGWMIDVGGYRLHLYCTGSGGPTVLLDAGLGGFSMDWFFVQAELGEEITACAWDRAGYGWSDPGPAPRTSNHIAQELSVLLDKAKLAPPYILVGHSFGAYNVRYFAAIHPEQVAGIVLVDGSHPDQAWRMPELPVRSAGSNIGSLVTFFDPSELRRHYPEEMWFPVGALMTSAKALLAQQGELRNFALSAAQVSRLKAPEGVPWMVITRGKRVWPEDPMGDSLEKAWSEMQFELANASGGRQIMAKHSGHLVHFDQPALVADAIRWLRDEHCGRGHSVPANPELTC